MSSLPQNIWVLSNGRQLLVEGYEGRGRGGRMMDPLWLDLSSQAQVSVISPFYLCCSPHFQLLIPESVSISNHKEGEKSRHTNTTTTMSTSGSILMTGNWYQSPIILLLGEWVRLLTW